VFYSHFGLFFAKKRGIKTLYLSIPSTVLGRKNSKVVMFRAKPSIDELCKYIASIYKYAINFSVKTSFFSKKGLNRISGKKPDEEYSKTGKMAKNA
jgi:hypothetical protein